MKSKVSTFRAGNIESSENGCKFRYRIIWFGKKWKNLDLSRISHSIRLLVRFQDSSIKEVSHAFD